MTGETRRKICELKTLLRNFVCTLFTIVAVWAQPDARVQRLDRNGDGEISRDEFAGKAELFAKLDRNGDGIIAGDELKGPGGDGTHSERAPRTLASVPDEIVTEHDIVYKTIGSEKIGLDLYRIKGRRYENAPVAIWIHGGGYVKGDKEGAVKHNAEIFVPLMQQHSYLVASLNYRLCTLDGTKVIDATIDCKDAVRFLVGNAAKYGIDPKRIVTLGASAGGGLALMMALTSDNDLPGDSMLAKNRSAVRAAVSFFGVTDFAKSHDEFARGGEKFPILFRTGSDEESQFKIASPVTYLLRRTSQSPVLLVHGEKDPVVPFSQSVWMEAEARRVGHPVQFVRIKNMRHGFQPTGSGEVTPSLNEVWKTALEFIVANNQPLTAAR